MEKKKVVNKTLLWVKLMLMVWHVMFIATSKTVRSKTELINKSFLLFDHMTCATSLPFSSYYRKNCKLASPHFSHWLYSWIALCNALRFSYRLVWWHSVRWIILLIYAEPSSTPMSMAICLNWLKHARQCLPRKLSLLVVIKVILIIIIRRAHLPHIPN